MALAHSPKIVTDGLVLCVDAANQKSYPGTGTTWTDLSGNGNNGTLVNGVGYSADNKGVLTFDGINDQVTGNVGTLNAPFTLEYFGKFNNTTQTNYEYFGSVGDMGTNTMMSVSKIGNQDENVAYRGFMYYYPGSGIARLTNIDLRSTSYQHIVVVLLSSAPYLRIFKNGVEGTVVDTLTASINTNGNYRIGTWQNQTWWLNGNIALAKIYNKALTAQEVLQNFQAIRGRYEI